MKEISDCLQRGLERAGCKRPLEKPLRRRNVPYLDRGDGYRAVQICHDPSKAYIYYGCICCCELYVNNSDNKEKPPSAPLPICACRHRSLCGHSRKPQGAQTVYIMAFMTWPEKAHGSPSAIITSPSRVQEQRYCFCCFLSHTVCLPQPTLRPQQSTFCPQDTPASSCKCPRSCPLSRVASTRGLGFYHSNQVRVQMRRHGCHSPIFCISPEFKKRSPPPRWGGQGFLLDSSILTLSQRSPNTLYKC